MMTAYEVLTAIQEIRKLTCSPDAGQTKKVDISEIDNKLIDLETRLLDDYGSLPQETKLT